MKKKEVIQTRDYTNKEENTQFKTLFKEVIHKDNRYLKRYKNICVYSQ